MNVFSSDRGIRAMAAAWGSPDAPVVVAATGRTAIRTVSIDGRPVLSHPLIDCFEPVAPESASIAGLPHVDARYIPRLAVRSVAAEHWEAVERPEFEPAPFIRWSDVGNWSAFERSVTARRKKLWADSRRSAKRLTEESGPITFLDDDPDPEAWRRCVDWKLEQYRRTGAPDALSDPSSSALLGALRDHGLARVSTLRVDGRCVAAHIGLYDDGRQYYWLPSYDIAFDRHGPGRLLLHHLLQASHERGDREFDFLLGDEPYKWWYATHARVVEGVGSPNLGERARRFRKTMPKRHPELRRRGQIAVRRVRRIRTSVGVSRADNGGVRCT